VTSCAPRDALTDAGAGSDVRSLRTTARRDCDEWVLNGAKLFIPNGGIVPDLGHRGQASFVVEIARAAYEWTLDHLDGRSDEHGPLLDQQRVQEVLADVATETDAAAARVPRVVDGP
jgi:alkylation response protein AidB-like acyl-CoA dehydrogenase